MTSVDFSHLPWKSEGHASLGQAVHTTIPHTQRKFVDIDDISIDSDLPKRKARRQLGEQVRGRISIPPIPDLRFEQSFLLSIKPFIQASQRPADVDPDQSQIATEDAAMVKVPNKDLFAGQVSVKWLEVGWVIFRDQIFSPLAQGAFWAMGGIFIGLAFNSYRQK